VAYGSVLSASASLAVYRPITNDCRFWNFYQVIQKNSIDSGWEFQYLSNGGCYFANVKTSVL
jgi:hypothetical protein